MCFKRPSAKFALTPDQGPTPETKPTAWMSPSRYPGKTATCALRCRQPAVWAPPLRGCSITLRAVLGSLAELNCPSGWPPAGSRCRRYGTWSAPSTSPSASGHPSPLGSSACRTGYSNVKGSRPELVRVVASSPSHSTSRGDKTMGRSPDRRRRNPQPRNGPEIGGRSTRRPWMKPPVDAVISRRHSPRG